VNTTERRIHQAAIQLFAERGSTDLTISDLANAAGVARGTLYSKIDSVEVLFDRVRSSLAADLHQHNVELMDRAGIGDPPQRLATGIRLLVRLAHDDPAVGRFLVRFGLTDESMREMLTGPPIKDISRGIDAGDYDIGGGHELGVASFVIGTTIAAMWMVLEGHQGWREAGSEASCLVLRALGVPAEAAESIATEALPDAG